MTQRFEAIIFDLDGVLVDSEGFYYQRRKDFLKTYGLSIDTLPLPLFIGADMRSLWPLIFAKNETPHTQQSLNEKYHEYKNEHPIDYKELVEPNVKKVLQYLKRKGFKIGLASSSANEVIQTVLQEGQLTSYFDVVVSGTQFKKSKPDPEIYNYTVNELQVDAKRCLVIEDSEKGIQAAHSANLEVWAVKDNQFDMDQSLADRIIVSLSDICKILESKE